MSGPIRTVVLARHPRNHLALDRSALTICPNREIARELEAPPVTFDELAADCLADARITVASEDLLLRFLREESGSMAGVSDPNGFARAALSAVNLLYRSCCDLNVLEKAHSERVCLLSRLAAAVRGRLAGLAMVAKSDALGQASQLSPVKQRLTVFGYARLGVGERLFVDRIAAPGSEIYLPDYSASQLFDEMRQTSYFLERRGWTVEQHTDDHPATVGQRCADALLGLGGAPEDAWVRSFRNPEAEVRAVLGQIKADVAGGRCAIADVVLVTRAEAVYGPLVRETAWEYGLPVQTHDSVALIETRIGGFLASAAEIAETGEFGFESAARLYRSTLGEALTPVGWAGSDSWRSARAQHTATMGGWSGLGADTAALSWPDAATRAEWSALLLGLLQKLAPAERFASSAVELAALERIMEALVEMSMPATESVTRPQMVGELRDVIAMLSVPSGQARTGIHLHTPLALFGAAVPHVFVLGASEGMLPKSIRDESLLDFYERRMLHASGVADIESAAEAARREFLSLYSLLLVATESVQFSYPRLSASRTQRLSPLIARIGLGGEERCAFPETAASAAEVAAFELLSGAAPTQEPGIRAARSHSICLRREQGVGDEYTGQVGIGPLADDLRFSASQLTTFGQCPYAWFTQRLLGLADPDEAADDLDSASKGTLFHAVLRRCGQSAMDAADQRGVMLASLEAAFDAEASSMDQLLRLPGWPARRAELLSTLRGAIAGKQFLRDGATIMKVETEFDTDWRGLRVRGRIDRIDGIGDELLVVDYKSGSSMQMAKDDDGNLKLDVQLPMYIEATARERSVDAAALSGCYYSLREAVEKTPRYGAKIGSRRPKDLPVVGLSRLVASLVDALAQGTFPVAPDRAMNACTYCASDPICRKGPHVVRRGGPTP